MNCLLSSFHFSSDFHSCLLTFIISIIQQFIKDCMCLLVASFGSISVICVMFTLFSMMRSCLSISVSKAFLLECLMRNKLIVCENLCEPFLAAAIDNVLHGLFCQESHVFLPTIGMSKVVIVHDCTNGSCVVSTLISILILHWCHSSMCF